MDKKSHPSAFLRLFRIGCRLVLDHYSMAHSVTESWSFTNTRLPAKTG